MRENFYRDLKPIESFSEIINSSVYSSVPNDWWVVITDVVNSTQAIEEGRYKDVNIAGGLAAMAISNLNQSMEFPYVFGGDGVTFLIPDSMKDDVRSVLVDTKRKVGMFFDLNLRVGMIPVMEILKTGESILVGKWKVSDYYVQAILKGRGVELADSLIKEVDSPYLLMIDEPTPIQANFEGFTCRWQDIPSQNGETVSLILKENNTSKDIAESFRELEKILGSENEYHPITAKTLNVSQSPKILSKEATVTAKSKKGVKKFLALIRIYLETWIVRFAVFTGLPLKAYFYMLRDLKQYNIQSSDFRKFDGSLKMVVSLTPEKRIKLESYLESQEREGNLFYGMHISNRALLTCLMHSESSSEVHFVDGADGGYAMAAKALKGKLVDKNKSNMNN